MTDLSKDALDALVTTMTRLADDMEKHATDEWDEHENVSAAIATITALRAERDKWEDATHTAQNVYFDVVAERDVQTARADAAEAEVARRFAMHECAMAERDDCIEDWSKAKEQIARLTAELTALRAENDRLRGVLAQIDIGQSAELDLTLEPVAWMYELATIRDAETGEYSGWGGLRVTQNKPCVSEGSIRDLTPLYAHPPTPTAQDAARVPDDFQALLSEAMSEAIRAMVKFPQPNYVISKFAEESGEVVKAAIHHAEGRETRGAVVGEMRQVLAMMLRMWIEGDQVHGLPALRAIGGDA